MPLARSYSEVPVHGSPKIEYNQLLSSRAPSAYFTEDVLTYTGVRPYELPIVTIMIGRQEIRHPRAFHSEVPALRPAIVFGFNHLYTFLVFGLL